MITLQDIYKFSLLPLLFQRFKANPEAVHQQLLQSLAWCSVNPDSLPFWSQSPRRAAQAWFENIAHLSSSQLSQEIWGLEFVNPIGLAAGFDKDGIAAQAWALLGFGFSELGTVTYHGQVGNPKPRLFRLPADAAALNRMGFNNQGAQSLSSRLQSLYPDQEYPIPVGINLGKSKITPLENAAEDYLSSLKILYQQGNYFVINVSSPNTPGLRTLQAKQQLEPIFEAVQSFNTASKPLLVKIAPDLAWEDIDDILELAEAYQLSGVIATNTTISRKNLKTQIIEATGKSIEQEAGGISGLPVRHRSTEVIRYIYQKTQGRLPIIGVGGVFTAEDAWDKITAGASLIQIYTGWIYEGPWMVKRILQGLLKKLDEAGLENIAEAVGLENQ